MAFELKTTDDFDESFKKAVKKNSELKKAIDNKVKQILEDPFRFKPLRAPLQGQRRVHVMKSFVIRYVIEENENAVKLIIFEHHDNAYD